MSNAHPSTGLQNSYKYHINFIYSTINNNVFRTHVQEGYCKVLEMNSAPLQFST